MPIISESQINLFSSLFHGRHDVYARYWEKNGRSGYSPAYQFNWDEFMEFKKQGGSFKDFKNKTLVPLSRNTIRNHLLGQETIGIYPILQDNTSYLIAADFDGKNWIEDSKKFIEECKSCELETYLERSRSGNGCHVWIFFEMNYPCYKSRQIVLEIIRRAFRLSEFDKEVSFDRLFPNQDTVPLNGFGNLIALPLQGKVIKEGKTLFLDPMNNIPYPDQWKYLETVKKHSLNELDAVHHKLFSKASNEISEDFSSAHKVLTITLNNNLILYRKELGPQLIEFLKDHLNFINQEYLVKKQLGKSIYRVEKYFKLIEESGDEIYLPRGFISPLTKFLNENHVPYLITDVRSQLMEEPFTSNIRLRPDQAKIIDLVVQQENGVIVAPSGSGKTIIGLELIAQKKLPALILVHRKQLFDQWIERIQTFLSIPKPDVGQYSGIQRKFGKKITVAMLQSLIRMKDLAELKNRFGTIVVDECHHIPAKTFREVISKFNPRYLYGLTATPKRKHNDEQLIYMYIGEIIAEMHETIRTEPFFENNSNIPEIIIHETSLTLPFKFSTDNFQLLANIVCFDTARNQLIVQDICNQVNQGKKVLLLSERKSHLEVLNLYLKGLCETIVISGDDAISKRTLKLKQIESGHYQVIFSTGQLFGEGIDIHTINCLIIAFPFSFEGKLIQYTGRLRGYNSHKVIIDYNDKQIPFLERQFKNRLRYYKKLIGKGNFTVPQGY